MKVFRQNQEQVSNLSEIRNRVVLHQFNPISAIVIENPSVVQMGRELFQIIWNSIG